MKQDELLKLSTQLNQLLEDSDKYRVLKYQYGIASRKIHELKAVNALLREQLKQVQSDVTDLNKLAAIVDPKLEPEYRKFTLQSSEAKYYGTRLTLKFGVYERWQEGKGEWWHFEDGRNVSHATLRYWVENYGPFIVVS